MSIALKNNPSTIHNRSSEPHGTYHLADNPALYEVQRSNNFEFVVDISINDDTLPGLKTTTGNGQEVLRLSVSRASVPHFEQGVISVRRGNNELKFAGVPTFPAGSISVIDYMGADTKGVLMAWQNLSYDVYTEKVGLAQDYKKDAFLVEYSPDYQVVRKWRLHGCWISNLSESDFNSDGNDKREISVTIQYDRAELDVTEIED